MKFKILIPMIIAFFAFQSCTNEDAYFPGGSGDNIIQNYSRLSDLINFENVPTDSLEFNTTMDDDVTSTHGGTKIYLPQGCIAANGTDPLPETLYVVLREYLTKDKMFWGNVQTESNGQHLVTGGNFWWKVIDAEGNDYQLSSPSQARVEMPVVLDMGTYESSAGYFTGTEVLANDQVVLNWNQANNSQEVWIDNDVFNAYGIELGWVNCDVFYNYDGDRTQFRVMLNPDNPVQDDEQMVVLFPDDYPSVINIYTRDGAYFTTYDDSIPMGLTGTLVGLALDENGNVYFGSLDITVAGDDEYTIDLSQGTPAALANLILQINQ